MMKKIALMSLLCSFCVFSSDVIYDNSFESTTLVSGVATGVISDGLVLELTSGMTREELAVTNDGNFMFVSSLEVGAKWSVAILTMPNNPQILNCSLDHNSGTMTIEGFNNVQVNCQDASLIWDERHWNNSVWN